MRPSTRSRTLLSLGAVALATLLVCGSAEAQRNTRGPAPIPRFDTGQAAPRLGQSVPGIVVPSRPNNIVQPGRITEQPSRPSGNMIPNIRIPNIPFPSGQGSRPTYPQNNYPTYTPSYPTQVNTPRYEPTPSYARPATNVVPSRPAANAIPNAIPKADAEVVANQAPVFGAFLTEPQLREMQKNLDELQDQNLADTWKVLEDAGVSQNLSVLNAYKDYEKTIKNPDSTAAERADARKKLEEAAEKAQGGPKINGVKDKLQGPNDQQDAVQTVQDQVSTMIANGGGNAGNGGANGGNGGANGGNANGGGSLLSIGPITIIQWPGLGSGQLVQMGPDVVISGTGGAGDMTIGTGTLADLGIPVTAGTPVANADDAALTSGAILENPKDSGGPINYLVNGQQFTMKPGEMQELPAGRSYTVEFDRGGSLGQASYNLEDGSYQFSPDEKGWELYAITHKVTIDNSKNATDFNYVLDNEQALVKARKTQTHTSKYPLEVVFDQGKGGELARKVLTTGTYKVGVTRKGVLDLFPADKKVADKATKTDADSLPSPKAPSAGLIGN